MTITATISPDPVQFGNVDASASKSVTATLSFSAPLTAAVTLSTAAPFAVSPTTVAIGETSALLTFTYTAPAAPAQSAGTLTLAGGVADTFDIKGMVGEDALTATAEKYLLLQVPDYGDTTFANPCKTVTGFSDRVLTSFLRLGKFEWTDEPPAARWLLQMIPQVTSATNPSHDAAAENAEANLGDLGTGVVFADDLRDRAQDWDDSVSVGTDSISSADDPAHQLTKAQRAAESSILYTRGGWRDHSDGNRISTTFGDKVEVVRGNYKMIVMGRQDDPGEAHGWDVGGSHIQDFAAGTMPGASFWLEWINDSRYHRRKLSNTKSATEKDAYGKALYEYEVDPASPTTKLYDQKGVWLLVNTTENVYEYARNAGNFREEVWGDVNETYVGSENPPVGRAYSRNDTEGTEGHEPPHRIDGRNYDYPGAKSLSPSMPTGTPAELIALATQVAAENTGRTTPPWAKDTKGVIRSNPHIIEKTWAERIDSHTGSSKCPVPHIEEKTWADKVVERTEIGLGKATYELRQDAMTTVHGGVIDNTRVLGWNIGLMSIAGFNLDVTSMGALNVESSFKGGVSIEASVTVGAQIELSAVGILHFEAYGCVGWHISLDGALQKIDGAAGAEYELTGGKVVKVTPMEDKIAATETKIRKQMTSLSKDVIDLRDNQVAMGGKKVHLYNSTHTMAGGNFFF